MERFIKFLEHVSGLFGFGFFTGVVVFRLHQSAYLKNGDWISFISNEGPSLLLVWLFGLTYFFSRHSAKTELLIGRTLFPPGRFPSDTEDAKNRLVIAVSMVLFLGLYVALAYFANDIKLISLFMFAIACIDFRTRYLINKNVNRYFADAKYAPHPDDTDFKIIESRREVAKWYLFELPHLWKEAGRIAGYGVALAVAIFGYVNHTDQLNFLAYVVLLGTLVINEITTLWWRFNRSRRLNAIELLATIYDRTRDTETSVIV